MSKPIHYVRIVEGKASFECQDSAAKCHTYPVCDCERWQNDHSTEYGAGHELAHHDQCIFQGWFDAEGAIYIGVDCDDITDNCVPRDLTREGYVDIEWDDEWINFDFETEVTP